jgi:hypothetical protein
MEYGSSVNGKCLPFGVLSDSTHLSSELWLLYPDAASRGDWDEPVNRLLC